MSSGRALGRRGVLIVAAALLVGGGCKARDLGWEFQLEPSLDDVTHALQAHLMPGSCIDGPSPDRPRESVAYRFARGEEPPVAIRSLPPGTWAFEVEALDASCRPIGRGCQVLELPTDEASVRIVVGSIPPEPRVCDGSCAAGVCVGDGQDQDGGARDAAAGQDATMVDAGAIQDADVDGGAEPSDGGAEDASGTDAAL